MFYLQGLHDFLPVRNIRTLVPQIRTLEGKFDSLSAQSVMLLLQYPVIILHVHCMWLLSERQNFTAVQAATWVKRTFALKPALNQIRKERAEHRQAQSDQVDTMY